MRCSESLQTLYLTDKIAAKMIEFPNPSIKMTAFKGFQFIEGFYNMIPSLMEKAIAAANKNMC